MTFWSTEKLRHRTDVIKKFKPKQIDGNAYKMRMGDTYYITGEAGDEINYSRKLDKSDFFEIPPGQFAYLRTEEFVVVPPDAMGFISVSKRLKFKGLINVSGFHVEPGYEGRLIFAVFNASPKPQLIRRGDDCFKIWFSNLTSGFSAMDEMRVPTPEAEIDGDMISSMTGKIISLKSTTEKLEKINNRINKFEAESKVIQFLIFSVIIGVIVLGFERCTEENPSNQNDSNVYIHEYSVISNIS